LHGALGELNDGGQQGRLYRSQVWFVFVAHADESRGS
jgi:hypothetical protein